MARTGDSAIAPPGVATLRPPLRDGLVTNEYATFNRNDIGSVTSPDWEAGGGSLFARRGYFWSGVPDSCASDRLSQLCTNSNVFRLNTRRSFSGNVRVSVAIRQNRQLYDPDCAASRSCWHGVHIWLRHRSQYDLYYASIQRADATVVIKRKVPCGTENKGTYVELSPYVPHSVSPEQWRHYSVTVATNPDGAVVIRVFDDDSDPNTPIATGVDQGGLNPHWSPRCTTPGHYPTAAYPPLTGSGSIGIRGDYMDFEFTKVVVDAF